MATRIRRVDYFYANIKDRPGEGYRVLSALAGGGVNLLAFNAVPIGPVNTQFVLFPESGERLVESAGRTGLRLEGPQQAILVQGDDKLGALAEVHQKLSDAGIHVYASNGVTDGRGGYGYVLYVRPEDFEAAAGTLGV